MTAILKREFKSYFATPLGFLILAVYYFFLGLFFYYVFSCGSSDIESVIISMPLIIMFTVPVLTMRIFSDDRKQKVDQVLFTAPVKIRSIVFGKFLAAFCIYLLCFAPTVIFEIIILSFVKVSTIPYIYSLFGVFLLGGALISIGMFVSSLTENVVVSAIITLAIEIVVIYSNSLAELINVEFISKIAEKIAFLTVVNNFSVPVFSVPDVVFFLSIIFAFLFLCIQSLEKRRWS